MYGFELCKLCLSFSGVQAAEWASSSPADGQTVFACSGDTVTLTWQYVLGAGETAGDKEWLYDGHSEEVVAFMTHNQFLPSAAFSNRVEVVGNAGVRLSKVVVGDNGNYSVEVHVFTNTGFHTLMRRYVFLAVSGQCTEF
jgi:hypothetical protein